MPDCPLADECPSFSERIEGMGCQHYGDRGGAEWCNHYNQPIKDLQGQPVKPGEEVVIEVEDIHESGAGVGRTEDGFIIMVDGLLPPTRARIEVTHVRSNHARGEEIERLPPEGEEGDDEKAEDVEADDAEADDAEADDGEADDEEPGDDDDEEEARDRSGPGEPRLGSRDNFWGG